MKNILRVVNGDRVFRSIGVNIKTRRKFLNLTQAEICQKLSCDKRYFQKIEAGRASMTIWTLLRIANALEVDLCALVTEHSVQLNNDRNEQRLEN